MSDKQDKTWLTALWDDGAFEREDAVDADEALRRLRAVNQELLFSMQYILSKDHIGHIHDTASAAIAKATGETP